MIAFNTNFIFPSDVEPFSSINPKINTINVLQKMHLLSNLSWTIKSPWIDMSGKKIRFYSEKHFNEFQTLENWSLEIKDTLVLSWHSEKREIYYQKGLLYSKDILLFWILHTFFPLVLDLERKHTMLHVGSVEVKEKPILFSAQSFGGKSTLTNYFLEQNHALFSDDSLAIKEYKDTYWAIPSYPFNRPYREFETLGKPVKNFAKKPKPIHAMYVLKKSSPDDKIQIIPLKGLEKYKAFHYSNFIDFDFMTKERFLFFSRMSQKIPIYTINIPWDMERLNDVYKSIIKHVNQKL